MSQLVSRTAKLIPYAKRPRAIAGFTTSVVFEDEDSQSPLGSTLVVVEALTNLKQANEVAEIIIETIAEVRERTEPGLTPLASFEETIKNINSRLAEYTDQGNASWVGRLSAVIALLDNDQLHLTQTGSAEAFLLRNNGLSHITSGLTGRGPHRPASTFGNIASGKMKSGDKLLLSTPALFHHLAKAELKAIVLDNSPNAAVAKLSEILRSSDAADRTAALITEISTPEVLAVQAISEEPDEALAGSPESIVDATRYAATPVLENAAAHSIKIAGQIAQANRDHLIPKSKTLALKGAETARKAVRHKHAVPVAGAIAAIVLVASIVNFTSSQKDRSVAELMKRFDTIVQQESLARQSLSQGDRAKAQALANSAASELEALKRDGDIKTLESELKGRPRPEGSALSITDLSGQLAELQEQADATTKASTSLVTKINGIDTAKEVFSQTVGRDVVILNAKSTPTIQVATPATKTIRTVSLPTLSSLGKVTAVSLNNNGDGIYILTTQPSVWLFKPSDNSLFKLSVVGADWPKAKSIGAYGGNIYLLSESGDQIFKHVPISTGYAPKTNYLANGTSLNGGKSMTVDGAIYVFSDSGLRRYISGKQESSLLNLPETANNMRTLTSTQNSNVLIGYDAKSRLAAVFSASGTPTLQRQYRLNSGTILAVAPDPKLRLIYAVTDRGELVQFPY